MAEFSLPSVQDMSKEDLAEAVAIMSKTLNWLLSNLDSKNVTEIDGSNTELYWSKTEEITRTTPSGREGKIIYGISNQGTGLHIRLSGEWHYITTTAVT